MNPSSGSASAYARDFANSCTISETLNNGMGWLCAWMTLVGIGQRSPLAPGIRVGIHLAFLHQLDKLYNDNDDLLCLLQRIIRNPSLPSHCCALVGKEYALSYNGFLLGTMSATLSLGRKYTKTCLNIFNLMYKLVKYRYTYSISLGIVLLKDCPVICDGPDGFGGGGSGAQSGVHAVD